MTSIRLPEDIEQRLAALCAVTRRSKSFYIKDALREYLDDLEDAYIALERITKPKRKFLSSKDVLAGLKEKK